MGSPGQSMDNIIVFDIETRRAISKVGGAHHLDRLGLSVAVAYEVATGKFHHFEEAQVAELLDLLQRATLLVGYNIRRFDLTVLQPYSQEPLHALPTCDLMVDIQRQIGHRVRLDNVAQQTLGIRKSADGMQALLWWRQGKLDLIHDYCQQDVDVTRRIWEYGRAHGHIWLWSRQQRARRPVPVCW